MSRQTAYSQLPTSEFSSSTSARVPQAGTKAPGTTIHSSNYPAASTHHLYSPGGWGSSAPAGQPIEEHPSGRTAVDSQGRNHYPHESPATKKPSMFQPNRDLYDEDAFEQPTDFDAIFSGKCQPSGAVTGLDHEIRPAKAQKLLGIGDMVYENSGFSRNVHFDVSQLPDEIYNAPDTTDLNALAQKRRESIFSMPKKSKSRFVSFGKMHSARWLEWSEKTRMENAIKKEQFLKKKEEDAKKKLPAAIVKARKESHKFVNPQFIPVEEESALDKIMAAKSAAVIASKKQKNAAIPAAVAAPDSSKLSLEQWDRLTSYWDHSLFRNMRPCGYIIAYIAIFWAIAPVLSTNWVKYWIYVDANITYDYAVNELGEMVHNCSTPEDLNATCYRTEKVFDHIEIHGLWYNCSENFTSFSAINDAECWPLVHTKELEWQSTVIGFLLFSLAFGVVATILTTCGICAMSLSKRIYYYHSAGEMYFICGIFSTAALIAYPTVLEMSSETPIHEFGIGYYLAWGTPLCYFISAFCMSLDDMIHSAANCRCCCQASSYQPTKTNHV